MEADLARSLSLSLCLSKLCAGGSHGGAEYHELQTGGVEGARERERWREREARFGCRVTGLLQVVVS